MDYRCHNALADRYLNRPPLLYPLCVRPASRHFRMILISEAARRRKVRVESPPTPSRCTCMICLASCKAVDLGATKISEVGSHYFASQYTEHCKRFKSCRRLSHVDRQSDPLQPSGNAPPQVLLVEHGRHVFSLHRRHS